MSKDNKLGKVIFAVGVLIFIGALGYGYLIKGANALIANCVMGFGLVVEFVGLCFTYRGEKNEENKDKKDVETKTIEEIKVKERIAKKEDVVEAKEIKKEEKKEEKSTTTHKKVDSSNNKKGTNKKNSSTSKKKGPAKKKPTPKKKK